jgi:hypothetical protein
MHFSVSNIFTSFHSGQAHLTFHVRRRGAPFGLKWRGVPFYDQQFAVQECVEAETPTAAMTHEHSCALRSADLKAYVEAQLFILFTLNWRVYPSL